MDLFIESFARGIALLADPTLVAVICLGTIWGVIGGGHPGGSATLTVSLAIAFTFQMTAVQSVAFLLAILVGVNYGNSIPAILMGLPGTPAAFLTAIDGYSLHRQGQTGLALGVMFVSSLVGQLAGILFFVALVVPLTFLTYSFLAPEQFALYLLGLVAVVSLLGKDVLKGCLSVALGLAITVIGSDPLTTVSRFSFGVSDLRNGIEPIPVLIGLLALSEIFRQARQVFQYDRFDAKLGARFPSWPQIRRCLPAILIGSGIGTITGAIPGADATGGAVISYNQAKFWSKHREEFGRGSIEGIAANEAAQQAAQAGDMIPTLGLGIPSGGTSALVLAALTIHGIIPGPLLIRQTPEMLFAAVAGLLAATVFLLFVGWPLAKMIARLATLNRSAVTAVVMLLILVGAFSLRQSTFDVAVCLVAGVVGYYMRRYGFSVAAAALGAILGAGFEKNLRLGLALSDNNVVEFATRPVTAAILLLTAVLVAVGWLQRSRRARPQATGEEGSLEYDSGAG